MPAQPSARRWLVPVLAAGLVFAVVLQWLGARANGGPYTPPPPLVTILPANPAGWVSTDKPIAESEELKAAVSEALNYDDAIFRIYQRNGEFFAVYAAHWRPGKMSKKSINTHTPDVCWIGNGWTREQDAEQRPLAGGPSEAEQVREAQTKAGLLPAQFRIFSGDNRATQHLVFWHIFGGESVSYGTGKEPPWDAMFGDLSKYGLAQRKEQWFVRIGASVPLPQLWADPGFQQVLDELAKACLRAPAPTPEKK